MTEDSKKIICSIEESNDKIDLSFDSVVMFKDSGTEEAYNQGYDKGNSDGYNKGKDDGHKEGYAEGYELGYQKGEEVGLAQRTYETWTLTLADGSTVHKEIALL